MKKGKNYQALDEMFNKGEEHDKDNVTADGGDNQDTGVQAEDRGYEHEPADETLSVQAESGSPSVQDESGSDDRDEPVEEPKKKDDNIPLAKYLDEKKSWKKELQEFKEKIQKYEAMEDKFKKWEESQKPQEEPAPRYEDDPAAYLKWRNDQLENELKGVREKMQGIDTQTSQQSQQQQLMQTIRDKEAEFHHSHPDYEHALNHVRQVEINKMRMLGREQGWDETQIRNMLAQGELQAAYQAIQLGINPAEYAYEVAKSYGYKPQETTNQPEKKAPNNPEFNKKAQAAARDRDVRAGANAGQEELNPAILDAFRMARQERFGK